MSVRMEWSWLDEVLPDAVVVADEYQVIRSFNPAAQRLWGYSPEEVIGQHLSMLLPARLKYLHEQHVRRYVSEGQGVRRMDRREGVFALRRDGVDVPCEVSIARRDDEGGVHLVAVVRDLSERRRVHRLARLGTWDWELAEDRLTLSPEALEVLGWPKATGPIPSRDFLAAVHPDDRHRVRASAVDLLKQGPAWDLEHRVLHGDGSVVDVHQVGDVRRDEAGRVVRVMGTLRDVTEARHAARGLAQSEATLQSLFATSPEAIILVDERLTVRSCNRAATDLARLARTSLDVGQPLSLLPPALTETFLRPALGGRYMTVEHRLESSPPRELELSASPVTLPGGVVAGLTLVGRDVTERREAEARLRQAQKLDTVGQLAGGIAHDFNNLLTVVTAAATGLEDELGDATPFASELADIREAAARGAALTRRLLSFARRQPWVAEVVDLSVVVDSLRGVLRRVIGDHLSMQVQLEPGCEVRIDRTQFEQVIMNLAVNARDAMPDGGTLTLLTARVANEVSVKVQDTGTGISEQVRSRLFEPFFTTKPQGKGTGLGLATCYGIVQQAGGRIDVSSESGKGATFEVRFPRAAPTAGHAAPAAPPAAGAAKATSTGQVVALAEDEPRVKALLVRVLERAGFQVLAGASGAELLQRLEGFQQRVSLLVSDVMMPGMSGPELVRRVRASRPELPVLFMSGYSEGAVLGLEEGRTELIDKPFDGPMLLERVRGLLETAGATAGHERSSG